MIPVKAAAYIAGTEYTERHCRTPGRTSEIRDLHPRIGFRIISPEIFQITVSVIAETDIPVPVSGKTYGIRSGCPVHGSLLCPSAAVLVEHPQVVQTIFVTAISSRCHVNLPVYRKSHGGASRHSVKVGYLHPITYEFVFIIIVRTAAKRQ